MKISPMDNLDLSQLKSLLMGQLGEKSSQGMKIWRSKVNLPDVNLLDWLAGIDLYPKFFWSDRDNHHTFAAAGSIFHCSAPHWSGYSTLFSEIQRLFKKTHPEVRLFGGLRFEPALKSSPEWQPFGKYKFFVPALEIFQTPHDQVLSYHYFVDKHNQERERLLDLILRKWNPDLQVSKDKFKNQPHIRTEIPAKQQWMESVKQVLELLEQNQLEKMVLARKLIFRFSESLDTLHVFKKMREKYANSFFFFFQINPDLTFMGVSPELLYLREGEKIYSEALAGTRPRGKTESRNAELERELKTDEKERREHRWVSDEISKNLKNICSSWSCLDKEKVVKLAYVQHLQSRFQGILKDGITDGKILEVFHPTPAVAGHPRQSALHYIRKLENFDRGWYAGPIGWLSLSKAEFAVALRSALIFKKEALIYGGAGIVRGSKPAREWQEIENKLKNYTRLFSGL